MTFSDTKFYEKEDDLNSWIVKSLVNQVRTNIGLLTVVVEGQLLFVPDNPDYAQFAHRIFDRFQKYSIKCMVQSREQVTAAKELIAKASEVQGRIGS